MSNIFNLNLDDDDNCQSFFDIECPFSPVWDITHCPSLRDSMQPEPSMMEESSEPNAICHDQTQQMSKSGFFSPSLNLFIECTPRQYQQLLDHINKIKKLEEQRSVDDLINLTRDNDCSNTCTSSKSVQNAAKQTVEHERTRIEFQ